MVFHCFSMVVHGFSKFFMGFLNNWISKNWKSIDGHPSMNINGYPSLIFIDGPSMIIIDGPSMNMVPFLWLLSFGPFLWALLWGLSFGPHGARATLALAHASWSGSVGSGETLGP